MDHDPHNCERCGVELDWGCERGPVGDYLLLCQRCEFILRNPEEPKVAPAVFLGVQPGFGDVPALALFNLTGDVEGNGRRHCAGSTVTRRSIEEAGYQVDKSELAKAQTALLNHMAQKRCIHRKEAA